MSHTRITEEPIKKDHFEGPRDLRRELELQRARQGARGQVPRSQVHNSYPGHREVEGGGKCPPPDLKKRNF